MSFNKLLLRIKTIKNPSDFIKRLLNFLVLIYKVATFRYGKKYWNRIRKEKIEEYESSESKVREFSDHLNAALLYIEISESEKAIDAVSKIVNKYPDKKEAFYIYSYYFREKKDYSNSLKYLKKLEEYSLLDPGKINKEKTIVVYRWMSELIDIIESKTDNSFIESIIPDESVGINEIEDKIRKTKEMIAENKFETALGLLVLINKNLKDSDDPFYYNKILNRIETIEGNEEVESFPVSMSVTLTNRCNLQCIMCGYWKKTPWDISEETVNKIRPLFRYLEEIVWWGGEAFLSKHFYTLFSEASEYKNLKQCIITNGTLIDEKWAELLTSSNVTLTFSIDAFTKEIYEKIRPGASFNKLINIIELINSKRKNNNFDMHLNFVVMKDNYRQLSEIIDFSNKYRFNSVQISPLEKIYEFKDKSIYDTEEAVSYVSTIKQKLKSEAEEKGIRIYFQL